MGAGSLAAYLWVQTRYLFQSQCLPKFIMFRVGSANNHRFLKLLPGSCFYALPLSAANPQHRSSPVPVVQADLRKEESLMQLFDSLEYLDVVVNDVFNRVSRQVCAPPRSGSILF